MSQPRTWSKMNASHNTSMSPNTFRRLLAAHGRTTTPGIFEASVTYRPEDIMKDLIEKKKGAAAAAKEKTESSTDSLSKKPKNVDSERLVAKYVVENFWPPKGALINPPLSKMRTAEPVISSSYSFYTRPFKVHGKEAWEFAMRGLGSVDTLLNRYGYVEPKWRGDIHPAPLQVPPKDPSKGKVEAKANKEERHESH